MNRQITKSENYDLKEKLPTNKSPEPDSFMVNFTKHTKRNLYSSFSNSSKIREERILPKTFYEATNTLIPKPDKDIAK